MVLVWVQSEEEVALEEKLHLYLFPRRTQDLGVWKLALKNVISCFIGCCRCPTRCTDQKRTSWCRVNQLCASLHGGLNGKHNCDSAQQQWDYQIRYTDQGSSILITEAMVTSCM
ncbi:hypothetical protein EJB05_27285, partial [Eragrostis curvula]